MNIQLSHENTTITALLEGEMTFSDNKEFKAIIDAADDPNISSIVIDFGRVTYIDSAGLGMLMILYRNATSHDAIVTLKHTNGQVEKVLQLARFDQYFRIPK